MLFANIISYCKIQAPLTFFSQLGNSEAQNTDRRKRWQGKRHCSKHIEKMEEKENKNKIIETTNRIANKLW